MTFVQSLSATVLLAPQVATDAAFTGSYVDLQGLVVAGARNAMFLFNVGVGTTAGTATATIQSASTTAGADLDTIATFSTITSAGGLSTKFALPNTNRFVRIVGDIQTGKDMIVSGLMVAQQQAS